MISVPRQAAWIFAAAYLLGCWLPGQAGALRLPRPGVEGRAPKKGASIHTVITTECTPYFDWQSLGLLYRCCALHCCCCDRISVHSRHIAGMHAGTHHNPRPLFIALMTCYHRVLRVQICMH